MAISKSPDEVMHRVRVKLYTNYLPGVEGAYIARTDDEANLSVEQVCAAMKNRGGFTGNYNDLVSTVNQFLDEAVYQLCDGFAVHNRYFSLHPKVAHTFAAVNEGVSSEEHPVSFALRIRTAFRELAKNIEEILVEGIADTSGYIGQVQDNDSGTYDQEITPGGVVLIY
ncbi:DNA-binding domain-containing protein [Breznakiellaceae bacterium SP9]